MRLPGADDAEQVSAFKNQLGLGHNVVLDLQRVFACLEVHQKAQDENFALDTSYVAEVGASTDFSSKVSLAMSSHADWRSN